MALADRVEFVDALILARKAAVGGLFEKSVDVRAWAPVSSRHVSTEPDPLFAKSLRGHRVAAERSGSVAFLPYAGSVAHAEFKTLWRRTQAKNAGLNGGRALPTAS